MTMITIVLVQKFHLPFYSLSLQYLQYGNSLKNGIGNSEKIRKEWHMRMKITAPKLVPRDLKYTHSTLTELD